MSGKFDTEDPVLSLRNVGVTYQRKSLVGGRKTFTALRDVSFNLYHGESLAVIGRNGAGKSTLLKLLAGIIKPDTGEIQDKGYRTALLARQLGFDPDLNGRDNIILSAMLLGFTRAEVERALPEIIAFTELGDFVDAPLSTYSLGMRARLGFAVTLQLNPEILLIDEAMGVGDAAFQAKSSAIMEEKLRSSLTVVLVTHNPEAVRRLCNRAVWIDQGATQIEGEVEEVLAAYERRYPEAAKRKKDGPSKASEQ